MGGVKRKISIEKIEKKDPRAVTFSKRRKGLYSKASELCLLSDAHIAIIATPVSSNSNAAFYTYGHSSVDSVVAAFLANERPRDERLGFWWEDESLANSENPEELRDAMDSMSKMLQDLKELEKRRDREDVKKKGVSHGTHQKQTLNPRSCSASLCIQDDITVNFKGFHKNTEEQILTVSDNSNSNGLLGNIDGCNQELDLDQIFDFVTNSEVLSMNLDMDDVSMVTKNQKPFSDSEAVEDRELVIHRDLDEGVPHLSDLDEDQMLAISDNNNNALLGNVGGCNQELDFYQIIDSEVETKSEGLSMNDVSMATTYQNPCSDSEAVVDGELVTHRDLYDNNIHLSDWDEDQILAISDDNNNNNNVLPGNLVWFNQELDLDQITDFETNSESLLMNLEMDGVLMATMKQNMCSDSETVEDGRLVIHRDLDEDNLCFSEIFNDSIATL